MRRWGREEKTRIKTILQMTGFEHTLPSLIFPSPTVVADGASSSPSLTEHSTSPVGRRGTGPHLRSSLLTISSQVTESSRPTVLATLRTSSPSCPACRGPVSILFMREALATQSRKILLPTLEQRYLRMRKAMRILAKGWWKEFLATMTGRSLLIRLASQYSFLLVLVSMIKATGRGRKT